MMDESESAHAARAAMRGEAELIFRAGIAAADPGAAVARALEAEGWQGRFVIAVGKAAPAMMRAALERVGPVEAALVVTNPENAVEVPGAEVMIAAHPVPDAGGLAAGEAVLDMLARASEGERVLALVSGGGSALLPAPVEGLSLADKAAVNAALLASGADIHQMNLVRQQLSRLKGGGFLRAAAPAEVRALVLSDVLGDDLSTIASGLTAPPSGSRGEAAEMCRSLGIWERLPEPARRHLERQADEPPALPAAQNEIIGSNGVSVMAMERAAPGARVVLEPLEGDVEEAARAVIAAGEMGPGITLFGGETTVKLCAEPGMGGRNQQLALKVAELADWPGEWVFLSGGTDGRDGPTDAAGGMVDHGTRARLAAAGKSAGEYLARNDAYHGLKLTGDLLMTGGTGTNVADLQVLIRREPGKTSF
ncbi:glycerate kinase type-2 family protein [Vannielia sp. SX4]|uniref:glycerate kinase type-2 family protein n=1 Tax=Vannielia sp. SX4 TaxID=3463852 RepID=UPI004058A2A3